MIDEKALFESVKEKTLHQSAELISDEDIGKLFVEDPSIDFKKLLDPNSCLIEGNRGTGKSHLLKYVEYLCDKHFEEYKILAVYITFNESLKIESFKSQYGDYDPFTQWASMKTLTAVFDKVKKLDLIKEPNLFKKALIRIFKVGSSEEKICVLLQELIDNLEKTPGQQSKKVFEANLKLIKQFLSVSGKKEIATEILQNLEHIPAIKSAIQTLVDGAGVNRVIILFDEAAHTLLTEQQGKFFTFFKGLKANNISVKAAVYPLITNYGPEFNYMQDAKTIEINRSEQNYQDYISFFDNILKKRIGENDERYKKLSSRTELYHLLMFSAFGNPRIFFNLVDEKIIMVNYTKVGIRKLIKDTVDNKIWAYFRDAARTPTFSQYMQLGERLVKEIIIPELLRKSMLVYFAIPDTEYSKSKQIKLIFDYLQFGGIIAYRGKYDMTHKEYGRVYAINLAIAISENIIEEIKRFQMKGFRQCSIKRHLIPLMKNFKEIYLRYQQEATQIELNEKDKEFLNKKEEENETKMRNLFENLLYQPISKLRGVLTTFEYEIINASKYKTIKSIYEASEFELMQLDYVGPVRARKYKKAVEEYLSG